MKTLFAIFIALVFVSCADSENKKEIQPDYSTPEKALETFVQAVDAWDLEIMANSTTHPEMNIELLEMQKNDVIDLYSGNHCKVLNYYNNDSSVVFKVENQDKGGSLRLDAKGEWKLNAFMNPVVDPFK